MKALERYKNQVLPDDLNEVDLSLEDNILPKLKKAMERKETVYAYVLSADVDTGELELSFSNDYNILGKVDLAEVTYKTTGRKNTVHIGRSIDTVGKTIGVKVLDIDESNENLTIVHCSRKAYVEEIANKYNSDIEKNNFRSNMIVEGVITGMDLNKVFVDIGGDVTAILGVADIARVYVKDPSERYKGGERVILAVKKVYANPIKVSLSRAMLLPGWESIEQRFSVGKIVPGKIKNKISSGVFIELNESFEGLAEEMPHGKKYNYGDKVKVCILTIDKVRFKIKLKIIENM